MPASGLSVLGKPKPGYRHSIVRTDQTVQTVQTVQTLSYRFGAAFVGRRALPTALAAPPCIFVPRDLAAARRISRDLAWRPVTGRRLLAKSRRQFGGAEPV